MSTLFVTATGTGVGKTYVTVELIRALRAAGRGVHAMKPVASGFDPKRPADSDSGRLLEALGLPLDERHLDAVSPWRFAAPLSPDMAAAREGRAVDWKGLLELCRRTADEPGQDRLVLIEGIGGVMVPLDGRHTVLDWIAALGAPCLLVAGSYLGTLSHTLTAAGMLAARGCEIAAVVVDESAEQPVGADETALTLERFVAAPVVVVPRRGGERAAAAPTAWLELLGEHL